MKAQEFTIARFYQVYDSDSSQINGSLVKENLSLTANSSLQPVSETIFYS